MNFYQFHVGDYRGATAHLTNDEDLTYRRLLDMCYDTERPIPLDTQWVSRRLRMPADCIKTVLQDFFIEREDGWHNERCEADIVKRHSFRHWASDLPQSVRVSIQAERNAAKVHATPQWLTKKDRRDIADIYALAALKTAETGIKHEVDHIVPLRSKVVCGLHVGWNLSVITASKNRAKTNSFEVS